MDTSNHDGSISSPVGFDLRRVASYFRRSLSKDKETIEQEDVDIKISEDQVDGVVNCVKVQTTEASATGTSLHEDVILADYVEAYNELNKMFPKLGRLFSFIASDIGDKTRILSEHLHSPESGEKYENVGGMLDYEKNEAKILPIPKDNHHHHNHHHHDDYSNGSRTLLRLHRALLFVVHFIENIHRANDQDKMSHLARKAYDETLALYHPWLVRKGVHLAVHTLPTRRQLLVDLAGSHVTEEEAEAVMGETAAAARAVYVAVQKQYEKHQLLDLP